MRRRTGRSSSFFGLLRPYKGIDLLLEAWRGIEDAELWIAGMPRYGHLRPARRRAANVHFGARFLSDAGAARRFRTRRSGRPALPRDRPVGRAFTALGVRQAHAAERRGGFPEIAAHGCRPHVPRRGRRGAARARWASCSPIRSALGGWRERAREAAAGATPGDRWPRRTLELYDDRSQSRVGASPR